MRIKRKELTKHDPRFISSEMARKLYDAKLSKLDSQERWDRAKRRAALTEFLKERVKDERKACYKVRMKYAITTSELRMMLEDKGISYNEASFSRKKPQKF